MDDKTLPENIRQTIDLIVAVFRKIQKKPLDKVEHKSLCNKSMKGCAV
ncbi:MAG: hypothetical protein PHI85_09885 [Victivallaceae bacterium]|nr:hypothetical protein [Victivallaceae bacterium]